MSIDGNWDFTVKSPMGEQKFSAELTSDGETLTGMVHSEQGDKELADGVVKDGEVSFVLVKFVMGMNLKFNGELAGDTITGKLKAGMMSGFDTVGTRSA